MAWDFQQCGILTSLDADKPVQPLFKLRNSKWCSVSSLTLIEYSSNKQRLWSDCAYAQADLRLCWSHISYCWKSHALALIMFCWHAQKEDIKLWYFKSTSILYISALLLFRKDLRQFPIQSAQILTAFKLG